MTPQDSMGMGNPNNSTGSSALYNSVSSSGMPPEENMEQSQNPVEPQNPAEALLQEFSSAIQPMTTFLQKPEIAVSAKEVDLVKKSLENLLGALVNKLAPSTGEESMGNSSY